MLSRGLQGGFEMSFKQNFQDSALGGIIVIILVLTPGTLMFGYGAWLFLQFGFDVWTVIGFFLLVVGYFWLKMVFKIFQEIGDDQCKHLYADWCHNPKFDEQENCGWYGHESDCPNYDSKTGDE